MDLFEYAKQQNASQEPSAEKKSDDPQGIFSVFDLTVQLKSALAARFPQKVWVKGELSNYKGRNQSGHMYFSLKDDRAILNCAFFKGLNNRVKFELEEGMEVLVCGKIDLYEKAGRYQLIVEDIRAGGMGELFLRFEQMKKKLEKEGLFLEEHKKPLPVHPKTVGLITSPTGAAIRDMIHVLRSRAPSIKVLLIPAKVQGDGSWQDIKKAIEWMNAPELNVDVMIVGRGGGSIEDLWAFNEEGVARAIFNSKVPVISAVGHQTDFTIADFVADKRAATPTHSIELSVPNEQEQFVKAKDLMRQMIQEMLALKKTATEKLKGLQNASVLKDPYQFFRSRMQQLDFAIESLQVHLKNKHVKIQERVKRVEQHLVLQLGTFYKPRFLRFQKAASNLSLLNPLAILSRGYSVVKTNVGKVLKKSSEVKVGEKVKVQLFEGGLECQVISTLKP